MFPLKHGLSFHFLLHCCSTPVFDGKKTVCYTRVVQMHGCLEPFLPGIENRMPLAFYLHENISDTCAAGASERKNMAKRVTIEMVAKEAGVSRGTVDRVINCRPHVREDQYEKVMAAIRNLGYEPKRQQAAALGIRIGQKQVCRLGVILPSRNPWYMNEINRGIRDGETQLADYSVEILTEQCSSSPYPEEVVGLMDSLVERGVSGIVMCVMDCEPVARKIGELSSRGIPVVTFDSDVSGSRLFFLGKDIVRTGRVAGGLMAKYIAPGARILIGMGNREIPADVERTEAFIDAMKSCGFTDGMFEIMETFNDYTLTYEKTRQALRSSGGIAGIYMAHHSLTACMDAIRAEGCDPRPLVIFGDMNERVIRYLQSRELQFCVLPNTYMMGYRPLILLKEYVLDHRTPEEKELYTPIEIICRENCR